MHRQSTTASSNGAEADSKAAELKREKKLRKVLKEALTKEQEKSRALEKELEKMKARNAELERENHEKETKYLDLYMENSQQHEQIVRLQNQLPTSNPYEVTFTYSYPSGQHRHPLAYLSINHHARGAQSRKQLHLKTIEHSRPGRLFRTSGYLRETNL